MSKYSFFKYDLKSTQKGNTSLLTNIKKIFIQDKSSTVQLQRKRLLTSNEIGQYFDKSTNEINKIFFDLRWITKKDRWIVPTERGRANGAKEHYYYKSGLKSVKWEETLLKNEEFLNYIT